MRKIISTRALVFVGIAFFIIFWCISGKVAGNENNEDARRMYYRNLEKTYEEVLRDVLNKKGYSNAGINICSVIYPDGNREYSVSIHHSKLTEATDSEKEEFLEDISSLTFTDDETVINYSIL